MFPSMCCSLIVQTTKRRMPLIKRDDINGDGDFILHKQTFQNYLCIPLVSSCIYCLTFSWPPPAQGPFYLSNNFHIIYHPVLKWYVSASFHFFTVKCQYAWKIFFLFYLSLLFKLNVQDLHTWLYKDYFLSYSQTSRNADYPSIQPGN